MSAKKPVLGRGLEALFSASALPSAAASFSNPAPAPVVQIPIAPAMETSPLRQLSIAEIHPNPFQPRKDFDPEKLEELVASINEHGILQPIIVRGSAGEYQIVAGERRWRAAQQAGLTEVPVIVKDFTDQEMTEAALIENIQRDDLNPIEEARAYETLVENFGLTQEAIATGVGKSRVAITNALRLLRLPGEIIEMLQRDQLSAGHARAILSLNTSEEQLSLAREVIAKQLSVRETERISKHRQREARAKEIYL